MKNGIHRREFLKRAPALLLAIFTFGMMQGLWGAGPAISKEEMQKKLYLDYGYGACTAGIQQFADKKMKEAEALFDMALERDPTLGRAWEIKGDILFGNDDFAGAIKCYKEAAKLMPEDFFVLYNMACAESRSGDKAGALTHVEGALKLGYNRFANLEKDNDLKAAREGAEFAALLEKYRKEPVKQTAVSELLLADRDGKLTILEKLATAPPDKPPVEWRNVADKALQDSDGTVRIGGLNLYRIFGGPEKMDVFVRGLFDNNGYVNKFAGNALVVENEKAVPYVEAIMALDTKEAESVKFYVKQIQRLLQAKPGP